MKHPDKWRDNIDPFSLPYKAFKPTEILGYPHAGNDVFHAKGLFDGKEVKAYIKAARQMGSSIENEVAILSQLRSPMTPTVIDYGFEGTPFSATLELQGERLSTIVGDNQNLESISYLAEYGATLARLHRLNIQAENAKDRKFFHTPSDDLLKSLQLEELKDFFSQPPKTPARCFCHGDFHYANVLWYNHHISGILDFELSGIGNRDFDIAWAMFRRPGQRFFLTKAEQEEFLQGYLQFGECDIEAIEYYMAQCYVYFLQFSLEDAEYCNYIRTWIKRLI